MALLLAQTLPPPVLSIKTAIERFLSSLTRPCRILVAVSGGSDSTGLLLALEEALAKTADRHPHSLCAVTIDHDLRPGSAQEAAWVANFCQARGIAHAVKTWRAEKPQSGIMAAAREARYRLIAEAAEDFAADLAVTGHTLDDQAETLHMQSARSDAPAPGIPPAMLFARKLWIVRPLLACRRQEIRDQLSAKGVAWIDDPSNDNSAFERVRIRKSLSGVAAPASLDRGGVADRAADWLARHVTLHEGVLGEIDKEGLAAPSEILIYGLSRLSAIFGGRSHGPSRAAMTRLLAFLSSDVGPGRLTLSGTLFVRRKQGLHLCREERGLPLARIEPGNGLLWDGRVQIDNLSDRCIEVRVAERRASAKSMLSQAQAAVPQWQVWPEARDEGHEGQTVRLRPGFALFDRFLPIADLGFANQIAALFAADAYCAPPLSGYDGKTDRNRGFSWQPAPATLC